MPYAARSPPRAHHDTDDTEDRPDDERGWLGDSGTVLNALKRRSLTIPGHAELYSMTCVPASYWRAVGCPCEGLKSCGAVRSEDHRAIQEYATRTEVVRVRVKHVHRQPVARHDRTLRLLARCWSQRVPRLRKSRRTRRSRCSTARSRFHRGHDQSGLRPPNPRDHGRIPYSEEEPLPETHACSRMLKIEPSPDKLEQKQTVSSHTSLEVTGDYTPWN